MFAPIQSSIEHDPTEIENQAVRAMFTHWQDCAGGRWAPSWRDIDIMTLPGPLLPYVLVCDVTADEGFRYRYWGRGHTAYHGKDYTGKQLNDMSPAWVRDFLNHQYMRILETRKPKVFETRYEGMIDPVYSVRLPLSDDGEKVTGILGLAERGGVEQELAKWVAANAEKKLP